MKNSPNKKQLLKEMFYVVGRFGQKLNFVLTLTIWNLIFSSDIFFSGSSQYSYLFYCKNWCTTSITYNTRVISWQLIDVNPLACNLSLVKLLFFQTAQQQAGYEFWHFSIISPCKQLRYYYVLQTCISKGVWVDKLICK